MEGSLLPCDGDILRIGHHCAWHPTAPMIGDETMIAGHTHLLRVRGQCDHPSDHFQMHRIGGPADLDVVIAARSSAMAAAGRRRVTR